MKLLHISKLQNRGSLPFLLTVLVILIALVELSVVLLHPLRIPAEAALVLQCVHMVLNGKLPYTDFFSDTVPMVFYLATIPVYVARLANLHPIFVYNLFVLILSWLSTVLIIMIVLDNRSKSKLSLILLFALFPLMFRFQFGQTEYNFVLLFSPFFLARWLRWEGQSVRDVLSVIAGIAGGVAINLHPFFILFPILLELFWFLEKRALKQFFSREMNVMAIVCASYWLHLFVYPTTILRSLLHSIGLSMLLQLSCHDSYLMWQGSSPEHRDSIYIFVVLIILGLVLRRNCSLILPLILFDLAAFMNFIVKGRGTSSDLLLVNATSLILLPILYFSFAKFFRLKSVMIPRGLLWLGAIAASGCLLLLCCDMMRFAPFQSLKPLGYRGYQNKRDTAPFADLLEKYSNLKEPVLILTNEVRPAYPLLLQLNRIPSSYYLTGFPIYLMNLADEQNAPKEWWQEDMACVPDRLRRDLLLQKPVLVLIEVGPPWDKMRESSFGKALKEHYQSCRGGSLWDIDEFAKHVAYPVEYVGERRAFALYIRKKLSETF